MQPQAGGMLRYGIPEYRLQKDMMDREINGVWELGVEFQANVKLGQDFSVDDLLNQGYDAVYLALAEALDASLLTHDQRLATATRRHSWVQIL